MDRLLPDNPQRRARAGSVHNTHPPRCTEPSAGSAQTVIQEYDRRPDTKGVKVIAEPIKSPIRSAANAGTHDASSACHGLRRAAYGAGGGEPHCRPD